MSSVDWIADVLPQVEAAATRSDSEWRTLMASLDAQAPSAEARESLRAMARSVRALHQPGALRATPMPIDSRSARMLDGVRDAALEKLEADWSETLEASITPVPVPRDGVRFSEDGLGDVGLGDGGLGEDGDLGELVARELGKPQQPPSWLWARVRDEVQTRRSGILRFRRNRRVVRWASAAALVVLTASLWPLISSSLFPNGLGGDGLGGNRPFDIEIISVPRALDEGSSPLAILKRARDGD